MNKVRLIIATIVVAMLAACGTTRTVPVSGRKQSLMVSDAEILSLSQQEYTKYMSAAKKSTDAANTQMVKRVGQRLANAVETYLRQNNMEAEVQHFQWEFNLVADKAVNAFCMPGGKIVVYEGLLPVTQNEASLAIVLGHEIAHAVAKHSAEQMSKQIKQQYGMQIGGTVLGALGMGETTSSILSTVVAQGFQFRNLKYSRDHESEADYMGLIFAAMAGYDPQVAVAFWQRMAAQSGGGGNDIFSDHPSDAKRIKQIQQWMPQALAVYNGGTVATNNSSTTAKNATSNTKQTKKQPTTATRTIHIGNK